MKKVAKISQMFSSYNKNKSKTEIEKEIMHNNSYFYAPGRPIWSGRNYSELASNGYGQNIVVYRAVDMLAKAAASVPLLLYKMKDDGEMQPIKNHPILELLRCPNPTQGGKEFLEALYTCRLISGNVYILGVGEKLNWENEGQTPRELHILRPDRVQIIAGKSTIPQAYRYTVDNRATDYHVDPITGLSQILHLRNYHPLSDWYGLSPMEVSTFSIDQHNQASAWNQALLQNGARPSGAIIVKNSQGQGCRLTTEQLAQLKSMVDEHTGPQNAGKPWVLQGGLRWEKMSMTPQEMDLLQSKNALAREIALGFGLPSQLLGIQGDNTYNNLKEARLAMWEQTVLPMVENTTNHLEKWLCQILEDDSLRLVCDMESISIMQEKRDRIWERLKDNNFMTINEKRQMVGLPEIEGGDILG